jgi:methylamine dehydrogenase light chain
MIDARRWRAWGQAWRGGAVDAAVEGAARALARRTSRRSVLARLGAALVGVAGVPVLPVARAAGEPERPGVPDDRALSGEAGDPTSCNYWRHCAIDGFLCSCCGGSQNACPPGTEMSPLTWIGTCRNPGDGKDYVISYNDCCGETLCMRCRCTRTEGERPVYVTMKNNDLLWCFGTASRAVHCSVAVVLGVATKP